MSNLFKTLCLTLATLFLSIQLEQNLVNGFSFDGSTVPCKTVNVTGYPRMKEQYEKCNKTVFEDFKKRGESTDGYGTLLCKALCTFVDDKLVDTTTGKLKKDELKSYDDMFNKMPELVRKDIKDKFYSCFDEHKDDIVYNSTHPHDCMGVMGVGFCIKSGIDEICNPEEPEAEDE